MADLSNPLTQVQTSQAQKEVTVNNLVDALSPAAIFGQNDLTTSGLTWGYYGGRYRGIAIAHGTIALPASQASVYIVAAKATGVVSQSTSITNWNDSTNYDRLYLATTGGSTITDWDDYREVVSSAGAGAATIDTEQIEDIVASLITAGSGITKQYNDGDSPATLVLSASGGSGTWGSIGGTLSNQSDLVNELNGKVPANTFEEHVQDIVASLITAGSGVTKQYNDGDSPATLVLTASGGGTPAGSDTHVQYNNAGAFGGTAKFTWNNTNRILSVNDGLDNDASVIQNPAQTTVATNGQGLTVRSAAGNTTGSGGPLTLNAGAGGNSNATGGAWSANAGAGTGTGLGGSVTIIAGAGGGGAGSTGGAIAMICGASAIGGGFTLTTGATSAAGTAGGNIRFVMGAGGAGGTYGQIRWELDDGTRRGTFHGAGRLNIGPTTSLPTVNLLVEGSTSVGSTAQAASGTTTINLATTNVHKIAMGTNITTLTVSNPTDNQEVTILFTQDGTGSRTIAWPSSFKWPAGSVPVLSTPAASVDMYTGIYNSTTGFYYGRLEKAFA